MNKTLNSPGVPPQQLSATCGTSSIIGEGAMASINARRPLGIFEHGGNHDGLVLAASAKVQVLQPGPGGLGRVAPRLQRTAPTPGYTQHVLPQQVMPTQQDPQRMLSAWSI